MKFDPEKLRKYRLKKPLTHRELSQIMDVPMSIISKWENGKGLPSLPNFLKLQELFKKPLISATYETKEEERFQQMLLLPEKTKSRSRKQAS